MLQVCFPLLMHTRMHNIQNERDFINPRVKSSSSMHLKAVRLLMWTPHADHTCSFPADDESSASLDPERKQQRWGCLFIRIDGCRGGVGDPPMCKAICVNIVMWCILWREPPLCELYCLICRFEFLTMKSMFLWLQELLIWEIVMFLFAECWLALTYLHFWILLGWMIWVAVLCSVQNRKRKWLYEWPFQDVNMNNMLQTCEAFF